MMLTEIVMTIAILVMLAALLIGLLSMFNSKWFGLKSRRRSATIFFGGAFACLIVVVAAAPSDSSHGKAVLAGSSGGKAQAQTQDELATKAQGESEPGGHSYEQITPILERFTSYTELQQTNWNKKNQWSYWVRGTCSVSEVKETSWISDIDSAAYEVTCELNNEDRAVLFFSKVKSGYVATLNKGDVIDFKGRLKNIQDWGFWSSGYVKIM